MIIHAQPGSTVIVKLVGTIMEGKFGTVVSVTPKKQRCPELFVILMDDWMTTPGPELVEELHLSASEFQVIG